jgi:hypothetical protein
MGGRVGGVLLGLMFDRAKGFGVWGWGWGVGTERWGGWAAAAPGRPPRRSRLGPIGGLPPLPLPLTFGPLPNHPTPKTHAPRACTVTMAAWSSMAVTLKRSPAQHPTRPPHKRPINTQI